MDNKDKDCIAPLTVYLWQIVLLSAIIGLIAGVGFTLGIGRSFLKDQADQGNATVERCAQECGDFAIEQVDGLVKYCKERQESGQGRCDDYDRRTEAKRWRFIYEPGTTYKHATCLCGNGLNVPQALWSWGY